MCRLVPEAAREEAKAAATALETVACDDATLADLGLVANGAYSPLTGFMGADDYRSVVESMRLADSGLLWPLPVVLPADEGLAARLRPGQRVTLADGAGRPVGLLTVEDRFRRDLLREARLVFGTEDNRHPGVARLLAASTTCLGGAVEVFEPARGSFPALERDPVETRAAFASRGWSTVAGFQTRNPVHRAHEYIQKCSLEIVDGLLLHPLVGATKSDDVPAEVRLRSYEVLLRNYYPADRVMLAVFPAAMRYAGPREAVFHAICRKNYGCSHFVVGRDHAGVAGCYGPLDAQRLVRQLAPELGIQALCFDNAFFCRRCGGMATAKTCPHGAEDQVALSGTDVREMLRNGQTPPPEYTRPEVAAVLAGRRIG